MQQRRCVFQNHSKLRFIQNGTTAFDTCAVTTWKPWQWRKMVGGRLYSMAGKNPRQNQENKFVLCKGDMTQLCCSKVIPYIKSNTGNNENTFLEE